MIWPFKTHASRPAGVSPALTSGNENRSEALPRQQDTAIVTPRAVWAVIALYSFMALIMFDQVEEDAFIYFRVAKNIAAGHGYVFNVSGEHIECGSSLSWQYLLAFAQLFSIDQLLFSKFAGVALGAASLYLLGRLAAGLIRSPWLQIVPSLLLALSAPFYYWVQRGLETSLYTFSIILLAFFLLDDRLKYKWYLPALLVALSRSEGFIVAFGLVAFFYFERRHARSLLRGVALFVGALLVVAVWRFFYFHDLLPHAFYLKMREPPGIARGAVFYFLTITNVWVVLAVAALGFLRKEAWSPPVFVLAALELPFVVWALSTHALAVNNRHLVPALPILYLLAARGLDQLVLKWLALVHPIVMGTGVFALWFTFEAPAVDMTIQPLPNAFRKALSNFSERPRRFFSNLWDLLRARPRAVADPNYNSDAITENWQYQVGDFIDKTYPKGITIAYDQMGQTPWYGGMDRTFIDTTGLTYRPTAFLVLNHTLSAGSAGFYGPYRDLSERILGVFDEPYRRWQRKDAVDHLFELNPELIIFNSLYVIRTLPNGNTEFITDHVPGLIFSDARLRERYVERTKWFLRFFERKDLAARTQWDERGRHLPGLVPVAPSGRAD